MAKKIKKIEAMHREYGENEGAICRNCCNFDMYNVGNRCVSKCAAYGVTNSTASDWNGLNTACGLYNTPFDKGKSTPLTLVSRKADGVKADDIQCEGQIKFEM